MNDRKTALLVEDHDELRSVTQEHLEELGYTVTAAADAEEVLNNLRKFTAGNPDLLVSDVYMPGSSGIELCDRLLADRPGLAVLLISSRGGEPEVRQRLAQGDVAFLAKPFSSEELAAQVSEAFACAADRLNTPRTTSPGHRRGETDVAQRRHAVSASPSTTSRRFPLIGLQALAAAVLVLGLGALIRSFEFGAPSLPTSAPGGPTRSLTIEVVQPLGPLASVPSELTWQSIEGASHYIVSLREIDGTALWQAEVEAPSAKLPADVQGMLHPAVTYYWSVEAPDDEGQLLGRSELAPFVIEPEPPSVEPTP